MTPTQACVSDAQLQQLAHDELPPEELDRIEEHLSECDRCRGMLDRAGSEMPWCDEIRQVLTAPPESSYTVEADASTDHESILRLLGPSDDPRMLGRIGCYEVTGIIGRGGMGIVFKAFDAALDRFVAIKMLLPHLAASGAARQRFSREGQAAAAVIDDHVLPIYSVDQWQGVPYLVTQYSRGTTLQKRIQDQGPLELKEILRISLQTARGLAAAHAQGLVHRDVKPSNILLDGTVERALLTDFGLARAADDSSVTRTGTVTGTPQYMSPEQVRGESVDARSDLFSLGCTMYAMCTGRSPFRSDSTYAVMHRINNTAPTPIREINPDVPDWLCAIIAKLIAKNSDDRFDSAAELAELLEDCLAHVQQPTLSPLPPNVQQLSVAELARNSENADPPKVLAASATHGRMRRLMIGAALAFTLIFAGVLIVLELNKGTLTIECEADDVPIRIMQDDKLVEKLTVSRSGSSLRIAAGQYVIEIGGEIDGLIVKNETVRLQRGGKAVVTIVRQPNHTRKLASAEKSDASEAAGTWPLLGRWGIRLLRFGGENHILNGRWDDIDTEVDDWEVQVTDSTLSVRSGTTNEVWVMFTIKPIDGMPDAFRLTNSNDPSVVDKTVLGRYQIDDDLLRFCFTHKPRDGKPPAVLPGDDVVYFECRRVGQGPPGRQDGASTTARRESKQNHRKRVAEFLPLGCLPDGNNNYSWAYDISSDGRVVVGNSRNARTGFWWTRETGMVAIPKVDGEVHHFAQCVSSDGTAIAGFFNDTPRNNEFQTAFRWTARDGFVSLGYLPGGARKLTEEEKNEPFMFVPEDTEALYGASTATAISGDGSKVVGVSDSADGSQAFLWTKETGMRALGDLPGGEFTSWAYAISADGRVIVGKSHSDRGYEAVRWVDGKGPVPLGGSLTGVLCVSADGRVIIASRQSDKGYEIVRWTDDGMTILGEVSWGGGARASADGSVIAGSMRVGEQPQAFIWDAEHGVRPLQELLTKSSPLLARQLNGWQLTEATGVSADGLTITGVGKNPEEDWEAWVVTLPPDLRGAEQGDSKKNDSDASAKDAPKTAERLPGNARWLAGDDLAAIQEVQQRAVRDPAKIHATGLYTRNEMGWKWRVYLPPGKDWQIKGAVGLIPGRGQPIDNSQVRSFDIARIDPSRVIELEGSINRPHNGSWMLFVEADRRIFQGTDAAVWSLESPPANLDVAKYVTGAIKAARTSHNLDIGAMTMIDDHLELLRWQYELPEKTTERSGTQPLPGFTVWIEPKPSANEKDKTKSVSIRLTGGEQRQPLSGLQVSLSRRFTGNAPMLHADTTEQGTASFDLRPGSYQMDLYADKPLPYVARSQFFEVTANGQQEQQFDKHLQEACEVVFRAIDVDTGKGIQGVTFTRQNDGAELWGVDPLTPDNIVPANHVVPYVTNEQGVCRCLVDSGFPWAYGVYSEPDGYEQVQYEEVWLKTKPGGKLEHTFKFRRLARGEDPDAKVTDTSTDSLELIERVTRKGPPWVASSYYLESDRGRLFKQSSVTQGVSVYEFTEGVAHPDVLFKARLLLPNFSRRASDYVARNSIHMWISEKELASVAKGKRLVRAFYYPKDAPKPDAPKPDGSQLLKAATFDAGGDQAKWLDETGKLGDLIAVLEATRAAKKPATKPKATAAQRLQGAWLLDSEEQFGQLQAARDRQQEPLHLTIEGHVMRGCFDAPWAPLIDWTMEFDNDANPQAIYLTAKVGDVVKSQAVRFRVRDDQLELCFNRQAPTRLPVNFRTTETSNSIIWRLKREPPPTSPPDGADGLRDAVGRRPRGNKNTSPRVGS